MPLVNENRVNTSAELKEENRCLEGGGEVGGLVGDEIKEGVSKKKMDDFDSGARSADKIPGGEDEGSMALLLKKVDLFPFLLFVSSNV